MHEQMNEQMNDKENIKSFPLQAFGGGGDFGLQVYKTEMGFFIVLSMV